MSWFLFVGSKACVCACAFTYMCVDVHVCTCVCTIPTLKFNASKSIVSYLEFINLIHVRKNNIEIEEV